MSLVSGRDASPSKLENTLLGETVCDLLSRSGLLTLGLAGTAVLFTPSVPL